MVINYTYKIILYNTLYKMAAKSQLDRAFGTREYFKILYP